MNDRDRTENHREHLANVTKEGKRIWLYPRIIKGKLYRYREIISYTLLGLMFAGPFIKIAGQPLLLLNVIERQFVLLGKPFWPQDFYLLAFLMITVVLFIVLFTVIFGRVWCGWTCPQTIFMEMVFRRLEALIEGNPKKRQKLDAMPWNAEKIFKKGLKHSVFFFVSFLIANTFLAYIIGIDALIEIITDPPIEHITGLISILIFTTVFYLVFAKLRELVCIMICPYGRLQGVMLDENSVVVAYDYQRVEPRGKIRKKENQEDKGDCVDCRLCVDVCPTGIDIRNGTQLECVNCTACIDACDAVMVKIDKPKGLIRFDSKNNIEEKKGFKMTNRIWTYIVILIVLFGALMAMIGTRKSVESNLYRPPGMMPSLSDSVVTNFYNLELINKTFDSIQFKLDVSDESKIVLHIPGDKHSLGGGEVEKFVFMMKMPVNQLQGYQKKVDLDLYIDGKKSRTFDVVFLGPLNTPNQ
jgi:cytochrome c oxidase accessory protein FixG